MRGAIAHCGQAMSHSSANITAAAKTSGWQNSTSPFTLPLTQGLGLPRHTQSLRSIQFERLEVSGPTLHGSGAENPFHPYDLLAHTSRMETLDVQQIRALVQRMAKANLKQGHDHSLNFEYSYLCPSPTEYKWQWFTDSCFHAIAIAHVDHEQSIRELDTLVATQRDDGFIGHVHFWGIKLGGFSRPWEFVQAPPGDLLRSSGLIQPPILAQAVERVGQIIGDVAIPPRFMHSLDLYHEWLATNRVPDDDGLIVIISPYESGTGQSPVFDEALGFKSAPSRWRARFKNRRIDLMNWFAAYNSAKMLSRHRFYVKEALVNGLYADSLATMARMHRAQGNSRSAAAYDVMSAKVTSSMLAKMLDRANGGFMSLIGTEERRARALTVGAIAPLVMPNIPQDVVDEIMDRHLLRRDKFWLRYPLPSVAATERAFNAHENKLIGRGPTGISTNWLVWRGMRRYGHSETAEHLAARTVELVTKHGLYEFYNPLSGQGMGALSFGRSALALDMAIA